MSADDWIKVIDHLLWWIVGIVVVLWMCGAFDRDT